MNPYATVRALCALALAALAAACSEGSGPPTVIDPPPVEEPERPNHVPPPALFDSVYTEAIITCNATRSPATIQCETPQAPFAGPWNVGGKGTHARFITSVPAYAGGVFQTNVRIRNLLVNRMGTADGATQTGIMAFVMANPQTISGTGSVTVDNPDSIGTFTSGSQRYFFYDTILAMNDTSMARLWKFNVPATVNSFRFKVYLSTPLLPIIVYDKEVLGNRDIYRVNLDGTDLVRLTTAAQADMDPTVAGGRLVWVSYRHGRAELFSKALTGVGAETRLTVTPTVNETAPALSLDGTNLAFVSDDGGVAKVWISTFSGVPLTNAAPVTGSLGNVVENGPAWERSTRIVYTSAARETSDLFHFTPGAPAPVLFAVSSATAADVEPAVSHDGLRTLWTTNRDAGDAEIYSRQNTTIRQTTRAGVDAQPTFLSDAKMVWVEEGSPTVLRWKSFSSADTGTIPYGNNASARNPYGVPLHQ